MKYKLKDILMLATDDSKIVVEDLESTIYETNDSDSGISPEYYNYDVIDISAGYYQIGVIIRKPEKRRRKTGELKIAG